MIYFADDDNSYNRRLFSEIRNTKKVGLSPVGNFDWTGVSSPIVVNGTVVGFLDPYIADRVFPVDMACISVNVKFWLKAGAPMFNCLVTGHAETKLLEALNITINDLEPKCENGTIVLAWHTRTVKTAASVVYVSNKIQSDSNIPILLKDVTFK